MPPTAVNKIMHMLTHDIWRVSDNELSRPKALILKPIRILVLTFKGYVRDNCMPRASALTFYSLLSVVPMVALAFGIAKGFGLEQRLEKQLYLRLAGQEEVLSRIIDFARNLLENTKGGLIAGIGVILLFWLAIKVLSHIEEALNHIWKVRSRSLMRKFTDYLSIMIVSPLLVIVSSSVNLFITTQIQAVAAKLALLQAASPIIYVGLKLLPFGLIWLLFVMIYLVMPNTQVRFVSALVAGVIAGTIFQLSQGFYINAQIIVARYNAIYGSFAALPLFLVWLQLSWMIVLLGAQIAHAHQYVNKFAMAAAFHDTSVDFRRRFALYILRLVVKRFQEGLPPLTAEQIGKKLKAPLLLVEQILDQLCASGLLSAVAPKKSDVAPAFQPAIDIRAITVASVLNALDNSGGENLVVEEADDGWATVSQAVDSIRQAIVQSPANKPIKDL